MLFFINSVDDISRVSEVDLFDWDCLAVADLVFELGYFDNALNLLVERNGFDCNGCAGEHVCYRNYLGKMKDFDYIAYLA